MKKFNFCKLALLLSCIMLLLLTTSSFNLYAKTYLTPLPGEFPIVALVISNKEVCPDHKDLKSVKECGFNLCMEMSTAVRYEEILRNMEGTGLKLLPHSYWFSPEYTGSDWREKIKTFVETFGNNPLVAGWDFGDEPKWEDLDVVQERYKYLLELDDKHFISYNLVGQLSKPFTGPCESLSAYLDSISNRFKLDVLSSDIYPIMIRNGKLSVYYKGFYNNLETFARKSKVTGLPMWCYCASTEFKTGNAWSPAATVPYLSFEAFSALAYGAQGIVYYSYWQRPSTPVYELLSALVDLKGKRCPAWNAAQKINYQIKALTPVFLGSEMVECRHTGVIDLEGTYPYISQFGPVESLTNDVSGVLVSHLKNDTRDYIVIVNHDVVNKQKVNITFRNGVTVTEVKASNTGRLSIKKVNRNHKIVLSPGGYAIFEWQ